MSKLFSLLILALAFQCVAPLNGAVNKPVYGIKQALKDPESAVILYITARDDSIPAAIKELKNVKEIVLAGPPAEKFPKEFALLKKLESIKFKSVLYLDYDSVFNILAELPALKILEIHDAPLYKLPESAGKIKSLEKLALVNCSLNTAPESLGGLAKLKSLEISGNTVNYFPESFSNLEELEELIFKHNGLILPPKNLNKLKSLKSIDFSENQYLKKDVFFGYIYEMDGLRNVILKKCNMASAPDNIELHENVSALNLSENEFKEITGKEVDFFEGLQKLNLENNKIMKVCESIGELEELTELNLAGNNIENLPESISELNKENFRINLSRNNLSKETKIFLKEIFGGRASW